jgi:G3E family GTPase
MTLDTIPLTIITGFLGAGKTTLLNRILHADHGLRVAVLVNDFGAVNIDSQLVVGVDEDTVSLSNGCICCTIRGDLIKATLGLLERPEPPQYIIVETSGVSDPLEVALTFQAMKRIQLDSILTVMDAEQILKLEREFVVLAMNQVGMADIVILNKVDLVTEPQLEKVRDYIFSIIPKSRILETTNANVPLELILNVGEFDAQRLASRAPQAVHVHAEGEHHEHHEHPHTDHSLIFSTWNWQTDQPLSAKALKRMIEHLPETIYRAKGLFYLVDSPDKRAVLQVVGQRANLTFEGEPWGDTTPHSQMVVIAAHDGIDAADLTRQMDACLAVNAPKSEVERIANQALSWLRRSKSKQ